MSNITAEFDTCLRAQGSKPTLRQGYDLAKLNTFLQEAYTINARIAELTQTLRSTRARYLSNSQHTWRHGSQNLGVQPLGEREREQFDAQSKQLLRQLNSAITALKQAEDVRNQAADSVAQAKRARGGFGAIGRWAAGGAVTAKSMEEEVDEARRKTIAAFREAVIMFLQSRLEETSRAQTSMMEIRLGREIEKSKSVLSQSRAAIGIPYALDEEYSNRASEQQEAASKDDMPPELSQEQMQLFAAENSDMLKHYEDQLDQVRKAERSILEISELHTQLHANLEQQSTNIDQLVQDSYLTTENLGKGNKELKKASERRSTAQTVFYSTVAFCSFLVVWDLVF
ncbi:hypothetical protein AMS68_006455 [Peltaster fructicola]|uniref:t-SNARE coiled-coil homology domain-containing protein n=1 Tax=Peltaster fructicola TaxID=286661 RepID=A0A6H0Y267_9PEZI|nr:hypothetical protein AMS68_006455 [Peltaster fructicola]